MSNHKALFSHAISDASVRAHPSAIGCRTQSPSKDFDVTQCDCFQEAPVAMWLLDPEGKTLQANRLAHEMTWHNEPCFDSEAHLLRLVNGPDRVKLRKHLRQCGMTRCAFDIDVELVSRNTVRLSVCPINSCTAQTKGFRAAAFDISASKAREGRLQALHDASRDLATSLDFRKTIPHLLRTMHDSFPGLYYADLRIEGDDTERLYPATDDALELASYIATLERHFPLQGCGLRELPRPDASASSTLVHCDGDSGRASIISVPILLEGSVSGTLTRVSGVGDCAAEDVTTLEALGELVSMAMKSGRSHEHLSVAVGSKQTVLANVAHEVKNVLTSIKLRGEMLCLVGDAAVADQGRAIDRLVLRMNRMLDDLMDQVSIERRQLSMHPATHAVHAIFQDVYDHHCAAAAKRSLSISLGDTTGLRVHCDIDRCLQVLNNLVGNAIKFARSDTCIDISAERQTKWILFRVTNRGPGLSRDQLQKVFVEHWQIHQAQMRDGHGLGLAIAKGIVNAWGGQIRAESTLGESTTFSFTVPVAPSA